MNDFSKIEINDNVRVLIYFLFLNWDAAKAHDSIDGSLFLDILAGFLSRCDVTFPRHLFFVKWNFLRHMNSLNFWFHSTKLILKRKVVTSSKKSSHEHRKQFRNETIFVFHFPVSSLGGLSRKLWDSFSFFSYRLFQSFLKRSSPKEKTTRMSLSYGPDRNWWFS